MADAENNIVAQNDDDDLELEDAEVEIGQKVREDADDYIGDPTTFLNQLPPEVRRRVLALKKLQLSIATLEANFFSELHALEVKYGPLYKPIFEKRNQITNGEYEPSDAECDFPHDEDTEVTSKLEEMKLEQALGGEKLVGIPEFWLKIFRNVDMLECMMEDADVPILRHLTDIKVELSNEPMGFKLHFHFSPNEYFTNSVLTKSYFMKCELDAEDPFSFEGPEIVRCTGCVINWNPGKNVTVKIIKKKQKHKQRGSVRSVTKTVEAPSFFNFFNPPQVNEGDDLDEEVQLKLTNDFEAGQYIRERVVPRAVLYYTGEALDDDDEDEEEYEEEEDEDDDDDDDHDDEHDEKPNRTRKSPAHSKLPQQQQDCKQQ